MDIDLVTRAWADWWETRVWAVATGEQEATEWVERDLDAIAKGNGKGKSCYNCREVGRFSREWDKPKDIGKEVAKVKERETKGKAKEHISE